MAREHTMTVSWLLLVLVAVGARGTSSPARELDKKGGTAASMSRWCSIPDSEFRKLPAAQKTIDLTSLNGDLLAAAILQETNRRRQQHRLPVLRYDPKAREAAAMQAKVMVRKKFVGHVNPVDAARRTLPDRL